MASVLRLAMSQSPDRAPCFVSVVHEFPEDLYEAMRTFVGSHPHWDQYRLLQVALAGFLFQQGSRERAVSRHYLDGLFDRGGSAVAGAVSASAPQEQSLREGETTKPMDPAPRRELVGQAPEHLVPPLSLYTL